jgi:hypothetical protein
MEGGTMLAYRRTYHVQKGRMQKALEAAQEILVYSREHNAVARIYSPEIGPEDVLVLEMDWETAEERDQFLEELRASQWYAEFGPKWLDVMERGGSREVWRLIT